MRVLVTDGSGFLGAHIVRQLLYDSAVSVAIVSRKPRAPPDLGDNPRLSCRAVDITVEDQLKALFDDVKPHAVVHTASPNHTDAAPALIQTNVDGTKALLQAATDCHDTRAFVYTSSDSAVVPTQEPLTEDKAQLYTETHFNSPYGLSKAMADAMVLAANSARLHTAVLRLPTVYSENDTNFIPQLITSVRKKEHKMQVGRNTKVFEFVYVGKAAEAHLLTLRALLDSDSAAIVGGEAFFISDGKPQPFFDFVRKCYAATGNPVDPKDITIIPLAAMQAMASTGEWVYKIFTLGNSMPNLRRVSIDHLDRGCCWSIAKARIRLGYHPVVDQDEAIKQSMEWAMANL